MNHGRKEDESKIAVELGPLACYLSCNSSDRIVAVATLPAAFSHFKSLQQTVVRSSLHAI